MTVRVLPPMATGLILLVAITPAEPQNGRFPWGRGAAIWPCMLEALPQLPVELLYRFVGPDLVLVDTHADLVVDILRRALR